MNCTRCGTEIFCGQDGLCLRCYDDPRLSLEEATQLRGLLLKFERLALIGARKHAIPHPSASAELDSLAASSRQILVWVEGHLGVSAPKKSEAI